MAKITKTNKRRLIKTSDKNIEKKPRTNEPKQKEEEKKEEEIEEEHHTQENPQSDSNSDSDSSESDSDGENLSQLLEPYSKEQLIQLITEAAANDTALFNRIRDAADGDLSHRKIFVHGLGWDTTREALLAAFEPFGDIEECNLVLDKATGKAKGYGFVLFKTRRSAAKALKNPKKTISNRVASCQLASVGPANTSTSTAPFRAQSDAGSRKIYVSSVPHDVDGEKLRSFFAKFGEIETGPIGFDSQTGRSRGFALFLYRTAEGAKKALEEPHKVFEGHPLQCQKAAEGSKNKHAVAVNNAAMAPQPQMQQPALAAVAAAQNMAMFGQHPSLYGGLMGNVGGGFVPGAGNPGMVARGLNPGIMGGGLNPGVIPVSQVGQVGAGIGGYSGGSHGLVGLGGASHGLVGLSHGLSNPSLLGAYGTSGSLPMLQGLQHAYPNAQAQQPGSGRPHGAGGSFTGYPSYMWV